MNRRRAVGKSGKPDPLPSLHQFSGRNVDLTQIGDRDLQTGHRLNRHGLHPGYRTRKCDLPRSRGKDRVSVPGAKVDSPVAPVLADRSELSDYRLGDRRTDTDCYCEQELEQGPPLPPLPNIRGI
jgi:hypothetical protein